jgi:hypothetical protein
MAPHDQAQPQAVAVHHLAGSVGQGRVASSWRRRPGSSRRQVPAEVDVLTLPALKHGAGLG